MKVETCMSKDVQIASPAQSIRDAARAMKEIDAGFLPVGENNRLVGTVTDRDIAVRGVAEGKGPDTPVRDDAPLEGFLRASESGELFAFRCSAIVPDLMWHWVLIPVASTGSMVRSAFDGARGTPPAHWVSILEDCRSQERRLYAVTLVAAVYPVPKTVFDE